ncbi:HhH-GPD-type base excision DNA repair protein [Jatrophihabitans sp.]|uniref:HhH-GPD-type base excision DNA repair protein n=1 Tax=Jatrophihabitans sp. TaxID=1932789 RepID=UPI002CB07E19|nr:HhH-GPD-type base excision DNA repair protein [Jatrophihabitans sp.]
MRLATTEEGNALLASDPLALLIGMLLDQQVPMEKAFSSPQLLAERMGVARLDAAVIAGYDPVGFEELFRRTPALHRFPAAMAVRVQQLCQAVVQRYDGETERIWAEAGTGRELVERVTALPGFGELKAQIFTALLAKQFGVRPAGWREATGIFGVPGTFRSAADVVDAESLRRVRAYIRQQKSPTARPAARLS